MGRQFAAQLAAFGALLGEVSQQGDTARASLSDGFDALDDKFSAQRIALGETEARLAQLTESGVRLLEIIQAGARTSREDLQQAIATAAEGLASVESRAGDVNQLMLRASGHGSELSDYLLKTRSGIEGCR